MGVFRPFQLSVIIGKTSPFVLAGNIRAQTEGVLY